MTCSCETCWTSVCHRYGKPCISIVAWSASVSCAQHCPPTLTLHSFQCLLWKHVGCFQLHMNHNSNISFFLFFCLFGETMFICNRRNPFRDVRTWGHLQNVAPRVALRLVSHMPFLTSSFHCSRGRGENSTKNNDPEMNKLDFLTCGFLNHENIFTKKG